METLALWVAASFAVGILAIWYGRGPVLWTFVALILSPIVGVVGVLMLGRKPNSAYWET